MSGFREFLTGEVLSAANVNNFLMKQSVMVFANAAARTTALGAEVAEGMLTYNEDTAQLEVFDGSAFVPAGAEPPAGIGSNVVQTVKTDTFSATTTGLFDITGYSVTITPTSATSKILVLVSATLSAAAADANLHGFTIADGSDNNLIVPTSPESRTPAVAGQFVNSSTNDQIQMTFALLHAPATTSPFTYKVRAFASGGTTFVNRSGGDANQSSNVRAVSTITAIEVAA